MTEQSESPQPSTSEQSWHACRGVWPAECELFVLADAGEAIQRFLPLSVAFVNTSDGWMHVICFQPEDYDTLLAESRSAG
jgi:hypothetical protein